MSTNSGLNVVTLGRSDRGPAESNDSRSTRDRIISSHISELVIALCGPIGSPLHEVSEAIKIKLESDFGYECKQIRLSKVIEEHTTVASESSTYDRIKALIKQGDDLREKYGAGILAELSISQIVLDRQRAKQQSGSQRYESRRTCHIIDSIKNQEELDVLRLVYRDMLYFVGVFAPLSARVKSLERSGMSQKEIFDLIDQDSGEELDHGQTVRKTFPQADFFLRVEGNADTIIESKASRFLQLILGTRVATPTSAETAMYAAASASGNSACLSRQVGAALTDRNGEILAVGWNDVPQFGGGLYGSDPDGDPTGAKDKRCWNLGGGTCFNDEEKRLIAARLVQTLSKSGLIAANNKDAAVESVLNDTKVADLIEFSRAVHAEMQAILTGARLGGDRIKGGKIYCTTYPCHSCARHIVAAGISEVYYIEPYRKSLATKLHADSITEEETDHNKLRILPYDGVAPSRYLKLFRVPADSRKENGKLIKVDARTASPRFDKTIEALPTLEALVVDELKKKRLIEVEEPNNDA
ncbi:MAG TPA: anti-phage dCTP deaminase [Stellaceae bacterium]|jgi:deoxycytidylate deaminase|nr:anti-phage dCTP deaminase [Stellaceae bacterium]